MNKNVKNESVTGKWASADRAHDCDCEPDGLSPLQNVISWKMYWDKKHSVMKLVCLLFNHLVRESDEFHIVLRNTFVQLQPHFSGSSEVGNFCLLGEVCSLILEQYFLMWCDLVMFSLHFSRQIYIFLSEHALKIAETAKLIFMFIDEYRKGTVSAYLSWYQ